MDFTKQFAEGVGGGYPGMTTTWTSGSMAGAPQTMSGTQVYAMMADKGGLPTASG